MILSKCSYWLVLLPKIIILISSYYKIVHFKTYILHFQRYYTIYNNKVFSVFSSNHHYIKLSYSNIIFTKYYQRTIIFIKKKR